MPSFPSLDPCAWKTRLAGLTEDRKPHQGTRTGSSDRNLCQRRVRVGIEHPHPLSGVACHQGAYLAWVLRQVAAHTPRGHEHRQEGMSRRDGNGMTGAGREG